MNKKCLSSILTIVLLLLVSVGFIIILKVWFLDSVNRFIVQNEEDLISDISKSSIEGYADGNLFVRKYNPRNRITDVIMNGTSCGIMDNSESNLVVINVSDCFSATGDVVVPVGVVTDDGVLSSSIFVSVPVVLCSLSGINVDDGDTYFFYNTTSGTNCYSQERHCLSGILNGSSDYQYSSCSVFSDCSLDGVNIDPGNSYSFYNTTSGSTCYSQERTCFDGTLGGDNSYQYSGCLAVDPVISCSVSETLSFDVEGNYIQENSDYTKFDSGNLSLEAITGNEMTEESTAQISLTTGTYNYYNKIFTGEYIMASADSVTVNFYNSVFDMSGYDWGGGYGAMVASSWFTNVRYNFYNCVFVGSNSTLFGSFATSAAAYFYDSASDNTLSKRTYSGRSPWSFTQSNTLDGTATIDPTTYAITSGGAEGIGIYYGTYAAGGAVLASYVTTSNLSQINVSFWAEINSVQINQSVDADSSVKYLVSFDDRNTWKYWNAGSWANSTLVDLNINGMNKSVIESLNSANWAATGGFDNSSTETLNFAMILNTENDVLYDITVENSGTYSFFNTSSPPCYSQTKTCSAGTLSIPLSFQYGSSCFSVPLNYIQDVVYDTRVLMNSYDCTCTSAQRYEKLTFADGGKMYIDCYTDRCWSYPVEGGTIYYPASGYGNCASAPKYGRIWYHPTTAQLTTLCSGSNNDLPSDFNNWMWTKQYTIGPYWDTVAFHGSCQTETVINYGKLICIAATGGVIEVDGNISVVDYTGSSTIVPANYTVYTDIEQMDTSLYLNVINMTINESIPTNTNINYLVSFDDQSSWKFWDGDSWEVSTIGNIGINGMNSSVLEGLNSSVWNVTNGFVNGTFDVAVALNLSTGVESPEFNGFTLNGIYIS